MEYEKINYVSGFTIIELLIAVGIFSVVVVGVVGGWLRVNSIQNIARDKEAIVNSLRFSMDAFGHEVLSGSAFPIPSEFCKDGVTLVKE